MAMSNKRSVCRCAGTHGREELLLYVIHCPITYTGLQASNYLTLKGMMHTFIEGVVVGQFHSALRRMSAKLASGPALSMSDPVPACGYALKQSA
eukprot:4608698-Amphidinium_carterae.1